MYITRSLYQFSQTQFNKFRYLSDKEVTKLNTSYVYRSSIIDLVFIDIINLNLRFPVSRRNSYTTSGYARVRIQSFRNAISAHEKWMLHFSAGQQLTDFIKNYHQVKSRIQFTFMCSISLSVLIMPNSETFTGQHICSIILLKEQNLLYIS